MKPTNYGLLAAPAVRWLVTVESDVRRYIEAFIRDDDVFRFLIAQGAGLKCVMPLLDDRCSRIKSLKADQVEILDAGLPIGKARPQIIQQMRAGYEATHWKLCVRNTLTSMEGTTSIP